MSMYVPSTLQYSNVTGKETTNQNGGLQLAKSSNKQQLAVFPLEQTMF